MVTGHGHVLFFSPGGRQALTTTFRVPRPGEKKPPGVSPYSTLEEFPAVRGSRSFPPDPLVQPQDDSLAASLEHL